MHFTHIALSYIYSPVPAMVQACPPSLSLEVLDLEAGGAVRRGALPAVGAGRAGGRAGGPGDAVHRAGAASTDTTACCRTGRTG